MRKRQFCEKFKILYNSNLFSDFTQIQKPNYLDFIHNYEELIDSKFEFLGTLSRNALFFKKFKTS